MAHTLDARLVLIRWRVASPPTPTEPWHPPRRTTGSGEIQPAVRQILKRIRSHGNAGLVLLFRTSDGVCVRVDFPEAGSRSQPHIVLFDSTNISLCLKLSPWAKFRRAKGGVKAHVLLDHDDYLPRYVPITEARRSDVTMTDAFTVNPGSIVAMDRGYNDYGLFGKWTAEEIYATEELTTPHHAGPNCSPSRYDRPRAVSMTRVRSP